MRHQPQTFAISYLLRASQILIVTVPPCRQVPSSFDGCGARECIEWIVSSYQECE